MSKKQKIIAGITMGDPNGIGAEVIMKTFIDSRMLDVCTPIVYGSADVFNYYKKQLGLSDFNFVAIKSTKEINHKKINIINCGDKFNVEPGITTEAGGKLSFEALKKATEDIASNNIDVLVTAPINKKNIQSDDFQFAGHTEYLANYANEDNPLMLMIAGSLRVGLVSIHLPLKEVVSNINTDSIIHKATAFHKSLIQDFNISKPKIAVLSLNPHAGDNGLLGKEETEIIIPAIKHLNDEGILAFGPFPSDGFFGSSNIYRYDGILAMYHDQGLTPFKALTFDEGVNFTANLPIVRTSPDHGVGYDITGKNAASENSFRQAIYQACDIYRTRREYKSLIANKMKNEEIISD